MGFEAMYNNSVAIAGCDKCQRGTGRKGPETLLVLLPGPGWDIGVAGAGEGSHRQGQAAPLLPSTAGRGASSVLPENRELLVCVWAVLRPRGSCSPVPEGSGSTGGCWSSGTSPACPGSQLWFSRIGGMLGTGSFLSCRGCSGCCRSSPRHGLPKGLLLTCLCGSPSNANPLFGGLPTPTALSCATACSELPPLSQGHRHVGADKQTRHVSVQQQQ